MTHTFSTMIWNSTDNKPDSYFVHLTRNPNWTPRNAPDEKNMANLDGEWNSYGPDFDHVFMTRLSNFAKNCRYQMPDPFSMWGVHVQSHHELLDLLANGDLLEAHAYLSAMCQKPIMRGICQGDGESELIHGNPTVAKFRTMRAWDCLLGFAEYTGAIWPQNHEQGSSWVGADVEKLIKNLPAEMSAPKFGGAVYGLKTSKGIYSERDFIAMYLAYKIVYRFPRNIKILEIGGGAGQIAHWLYRMNFTDITMVDIPSVLCAQAFWLGANIGNDKIALPGEVRQSAVVKFMTPDQVNNYAGNFDLVINSDSMPEMDESSLRMYLDFIHSHAQYFFSINQESRAVHNDQAQHAVNHVINKDYKNKLHRVERNRFWLRDGYTEEWYTVLK